MALRDIILSLIIFGAVPFILRNPYWGVLVWNWLAFMNPHRYTWAFAYRFRFSLVVAVATLFSFLIYGGRKKIPWDTPIVMMLCLAFWVSVTTLLALNPGGAVREWERFTKIMVMLLVTTAVIDTRWKLDGLIWIICLSLGFFGVKGGIFTLVHGGIYRVNGPPGSFIAGNNEIGFALIMTLPLMRYLQLTANRKFIRFGLWGAMALTAVSIVGTYSRGGFLAGAAMVFFLAIKSRKRASLIVFMILLIPALLVFMPGKWDERMESIKNYQQDGSAMGRINAWRYAWNLAKDRPIFGGGANAFTRQLFYRYAPNPENVHDAHSIYFEMLAEQGFVGLGLFLSVGISTLFGARSLRKAARDEAALLWAKDLGNMLQTVIVGYAVGGAFLGLSYWDLPYTVVAIVAIARRLVDDEELGKRKKEIFPTEPERPPVKALSSALDSRSR